MGQIQVLADELEKHLHKLRNELQPLYAILEELRRMAVEAEVVEPE